jgi:hypothetical protein
VERLPSDKKPDPNPLYCSFCGKSRQDVRKVIAGPTVFICSECVELCADILLAHGNEAVMRLRGDLPIPPHLRKEALALLQVFAEFLARNYGGEDPEVEVELKSFLRLRLEMPGGEIAELEEYLDDEARTAGA